jgi:hypothetical protein
LEHKGVSKGVVSTHRDPDPSPTADRNSMNIPYLLDVKARDAVSATYGSSLRYQCCAGSFAEV